MSDLVSVVMPAHNAANTILLSIESVLTQTYTNIELIVVDDASTDNTPAILEQAVKSDFRLRVITNCNNLGVANSRNRGIQSARGRYIAFCDADDFWRDDKVSLQLAQLARGEYALSFCDYYTVNTKGTITGVVKSPFRELGFSTILLANFICCSSVLIDLDRTGPIQMPDIRYAEDYCAWIEIMKTGYLALRLDAPVVYYRVAYGSESSNKRGAVIGHWRALRDIAGLGYSHAFFCMASYAFFSMVKKL